MKDVIVISLGGSMLFDEKGGIDTGYVRKITGLLEKTSKKYSIVVVVGGGKTAKIYAEAVRELTRNEFHADRIAILGTRMNALMLISVLGHKAYPKVITDLDEAFFALQQGVIAVSAGMLEGLTTDTDAVLFAERLGAKRLINVSKVDAIYTADPKLDRNARKLAKMTHAQLSELAAKSDERKARTNFVFDLVASKLAQRSNIPLHFAHGRKLGEVEKAINNEKHEGTVVEN